MAIKANNTHDISFIEPTNSKEIGLMLYRNMNPGSSAYNIPVYAETDDPALSSQFYSGEPGYAYLPPEKEIQIAQDDWRAGVGLETYDSNDEKRYWKSINMDLRFKNLAQCGPLATAITKPSGVVRARAEFNDKLYIGVDNILGKLNTTTDVFDTVHTFSAIVGTPVFSGSGLDDMSAAGTYSYGGHERFEVKISTAAATDKFRWRFTATKSGGTKIATWSAEVSITGSAQTLQDGVTITFVATTGHTADDTWTFIAQDAANITDLKVFSFINDSGVNVQYLCIAMGSYAHFNYMTTAEAFTINQTAIDYDDSYFYGPTHLGVNGSTFYVTVGSSGRIKSATDITNSGTFSSATDVGLPSDYVTDLISREGEFYIIKEGKAYYLDSDGNPQELVDMEALRRTASPYSGTNSLTWKNKTYIPCGTQSLIEYDGTDSTFIEPAERCNALTEFTGEVQGLAGNDRYLYAVTDNSTKVEIQATRDEVIDGSTTRVWHPLAELTLAGCQIAFASSIHKKRLYVASTSSGDSFYYYPLSTNYGDIDSDSNYTFQTDGYFITPWLHANFKADYKAYIKLTLTMADTSATEYFTAHYRLKGTDDWTSIGDFKTEPTTTKYIPADSSDVDPSSVMIQFKFTAVTGDSSTTPKLLGYDCRGIWYPTKRRIITCQVRVSDDMARKDGEIDDQTASDIRTAIDDANDASWPITFYNPWAESTDDAIYVKFLNVTKSMKQVAKDRNPEEVYELELERVTLS
jgi:hypothetical protein